MAPLVRTVTAVGVLMLASKAFAQECVGNSPCSAPRGERPRPGLRWNAGVRDEGVRDEGAGDEGAGDEGVAPKTAKGHGMQRPFAYAVDPSTPFAEEVGLEYLLQGASGVDATRPLPANLGGDGVVHGVTMSVGLTDWAAPYVSALVFDPVRAQAASRKVTAQGGLMFQLTDPSAAFRVGAHAGFLRELSGDVGASSRLSAAYDIGRVRLVGNAHFEKIFAESRDTIDVLAFAGASVRASDLLRVGAEYVGQDLEDAIEGEEAEGGARHFASIVAALTLADGAVWVTGGPAFGLNQRSPDLMGRLSVLALF